MIDLLARDDRAGFGLATAFAIEGIPFRRIARAEEFAAHCLVVASGADSPAAAAMLRRHDILLTYADEKIRDCEHFARLIRADKPEHKVKLTLLRSGQKMTAGGSWSARRPWVSRR